jgi:L-ascorbate metabolism protein UlaG (beta-lactamase superfamily)
MKRVLISILLVAGFCALAADQPGPVKITWLGHACFIIESPGGTKILTDPYNNKIGYDVSGVKADAVTVSHEHGDHNNTAMAEGEPKIIRGLTEEKDWAEVKETVGDVTIRTAPTYHDKNQGQKRGKNAVFIFETPAMTVVHLGDLGHPLTAEQVEAVGKADVLMIPVGGTFTLDAAGADKVIDQLKPMIVIPMHYRTDKVLLPIAKVDKFLKGKERVEDMGSTYVKIIELTEQTVIFVLEPKQ